MIIEIYRITYQRYNKAVLQTLLINDKKEEVMKKLGLSLFLMCCALLVPTLLTIIQNCFNDPIYYTVIAITLVLVAVAVWQFVLWYCYQYYCHCLNY